ncbi:pentapeptide repeat-containing protein [Solirubrobacter ginsenosidimutans]|uniref:Pentapeptide repeat-containing protein n=1 Tax=Solirubrobacter ginsenosidimutans TaxID=490573 RepID=A0A9X3N2U2_9ACTN|nr:pentapeptide repeat-containing protein [Solirubrobacter ginsenosidimutans]MDA0166010.1 pentapeptide repeat-containing protein [Solirubrobacter ginsenosidimutans]
MSTIQTKLVRILMALAVAGAVLLAVAAVVAFIRVSADWLAATDGIADPTKRAEETGRARTVVLAVLAGTLAAVGAYYTHRNYQLTRQGQITERFTRAVDQLGNRDSMDVRLGGIYALERVARDSAYDHGPIVEILTAFVRERTPIPDEDVIENLIQMEPDVYPKPPEADVQAALTVLGRRKAAYDPPAPWRINFAGCYLPRAHLQGAQLQRADLSYTVLTDAKLERSVLTNARLVGAKMYMTNLTDAKLTGVNLREAFANRAVFASADLSEAVLAGGRFRGAEFVYAALRDAKLDDADLEGASLSGSNLAGASLSGANLANASLTRADLSASHLDGARFGGADFRSARLGNARYDSDTVWPNGFDPVAAGAACISASADAGS